MKFVFLFFISLQIGFAQDSLLNGFIYDSYDKFPIPSFSVINLKTKEKSLSNFDGEFYIKATVGDSLLFSLEGKNEKCFQKVTTVVKDMKPLRLYVYSYSSMYRDSCKHNKELYALVLRETGKTKNYVEPYKDCYISTGNLNIRSFQIENDVLRNYQKSEIDIIGFPNYLHEMKKSILVFIEKKCDEYWYLNHQNIYETSKNELVVPYLFLDFIVFNENEVSLINVNFESQIYYSKNNPIYLNEIKNLPNELYRIKGEKIIPTKGLSVTDYSKIWIKNYEYLKF